MADLSSFGTKDKADEGVVFPVKIDGQKLPLAILIYGSDSDTVRDYERKYLRKMSAGLKNGASKIDDDTLDELIESQDEKVLVRIGAVYDYDWKKKTTTNETVTFGEKVIGNDKPSFAYLIEKIPALKDFIIEKSNERANFLA